MQQYQTEPDKPDPAESNESRRRDIGLFPATCHDFPLCGHSMWTCMSPVNYTPPPQHQGRQYA